LNMRGIDFKTAGGYNVKEALLLLPALLFILGASVLFALSAEQISIPVSASLRRGFPVLIIDPGHGGLDSGAVAFNGVRESDVNLSIALKMEQIAAFCGVDTAMTRRDDSRKTDILSYSEHADLVQRADFANAVQNGVLISVHQNMFPTSQPFGAQILYAEGEQSRRLGEITQQNLVRLLQPENRRLAEPAPRNLYLTAHVSCPAILAECGFLSNYSELDRLSDERYQTDLALILVGSFLQEQGTKQLS